MYLDYSGIRVRDLERSVRFYTEGVGLVERRRGTMFHGGIWVLLEDPTSHQHLELNWYPVGSSFDVPYLVGEGLDHLGFRLSDVREGIARLEKVGATLVNSFEDAGVLEVAYVTDPDGLWIELIRTEPT
jgi:lactoylglutathione lyase